MGTFNPLRPKPRDPHSFYLTKNSYRSHRAQRAASTAGAEQQLGYPTCSSTAHPWPGPGDGDEPSAHWGQVPQSPRLGSEALGGVHQLSVPGQQHKMRFPATPLSSSSVRGHLGVREGEGEGAGFRKARAGRENGVIVCLQHDARLLGAENLVCCPHICTAHRGQQAPKIFQDGQNAASPSPQQGVALIQTPVRSPRLNLAYSQWADSGRLTPGNPAPISAGFYSPRGPDQNHFGWAVVPEAACVAPCHGA